MGRTYHQAYGMLNSDFSGIYRNFVDAVRPYYGGFNFASYAYGPTLFNNDFKYGGGIASYASSFEGPLPLSATPFGEPNGREFSSIVGGNDAQGQSYVSKSGEVITLNYPYFKTGRGTVSSTVNEIISKQTSEILSSIIFEQEGKNSKSFCIVNCLANENGAKHSESISMYNRDGNPLRVIFPLENTAPSPIQKSLFPESEHNLKLCLGNTHTTAASKVGIKIVTGPVSGSEYRWAFNFSNRKWEPYDKSSKFTHTIPVYSNTVRKLYTLDFHTWNKHTRTKNHPCDTHTPYYDWIIHNENTNYYIIITSEEESLSNGITLFNISLQDKTLYSLIKELEKKELYEVFNFWNTLSEGYYSRDMILSQDTFETSGGSRHVYLETY